MTENIMAEISEQYHNTHENLPELIECLTDEQIVEHLKKQTHLWDSKSGIWRVGCLFL